MKVFPQNHFDRQPSGISRTNIGTPPVIRQQQGISNAGSNLSFASSQGRSNGRFGHW
jgi:hypothetical protein